MIARVVVAWLCLCLGCAYAAEAQTKLAVIGLEPTEDNLAVMLTAELSRSKEIALVERDQLNEVIRERGLSDLIRQGDYTKAGKLLGADALLILQRQSLSSSEGAKEAKDKKPTLLLARLVAVETGVIVAQAQQPASDSPSEQSKNISVQIVPKLPKLTAISRKTAVAISLLGLRFESDAKGIRSLERSINTLLASRLICEPEVLVLDRWNMEKLSWEKSLADGWEQKPFWTGSYLLDGSIKDAGDQWEVKARLRSGSKSKPSEIVVSSEKEDLAGLADKLVEELKKTMKLVSEPQPWDAMAEAEAYANLAQWALQHWLIGDGISAIESAFALGVKNKKHKITRIRAYGLDAFPLDFLSSFTDDKIPIDIRILEHKNMARHIDSACQMLALASEYISCTENFAAQSEAPSQGFRWNPEKWLQEDKFFLAKKVLLSASYTLAFSFETGYYKDDPDRPARLRASILSLFGKIIKTPRDKPENELNSTDSIFEIYFENMAFWKETPEEAIGGYLGLLYPDENKSSETTKPHGTVLRRRLPSRPYMPILDLDELKAKKWLYLPKRRLVDWQTGDEKKMGLLWRKFTEDLIKSENPLRCGDGLALKYESLSGVETQEALMQESIVFLEKNKNFFIGKDAEFASGKLILSSLFRIFVDIFARQTESGKNMQLMLASTFCDIIRNAPDLRKDVIGIFPYSAENSRKKNSISTESGSMLQKAIIDASSENNKTPLSNSEANTLLGHLYELWPEIKPSIKDVPLENNELLITRYWHPQTWANSSPNKKDVNPYTSEIVFAEDKILVFHKKDKLYAVEPTTFRSEVIERQMNSPSQNGKRIFFKITPTTMFFNYYHSTFLIATDVKNRTGAFDFPFRKQLARVHDKLYFFYGAPNLKTISTDDRYQSEAGIEEIDAEGNTIRKLISSRRTPPENSLDGTPFKPWIVYPGPNKSVHFGLSVKGVVILYRPTASGSDWEQYFRFNHPNEINYCPENNGLLIVEKKIVWIPSQTGMPEILLSSNPKSLSSAPARWPYPDDLPSLFSMSGGCAVFDGKKLTLLVNKTKDRWPIKYSFYIFTEGESNPVQIPVRFQMPPKEESYFADNLKQLENEIHPTKLIWTPYGLVIHGNAIKNQGFWFVPNEDLEKYIKLNQ